MRLSKWWKGGVLAATVLSLGIVGASGVNAQSPSITLQMKVTENRAPGAAGTVTITPQSANSAKVDIRVTGLTPNAELAAHIHTSPTAKCDNGAPVSYPLSSVKVDAAGVGTSSTVVTITPDKPVQANLAYVNVHRALNPPGDGIICADITSPIVAVNTGAPAAASPAAGTAPRAPSTGTGPSDDTSSRGLLMAAIAVFAVMFSGAGALAVVRRRR